MAPEKRKASEIENDVTPKSRGRPKKDVQKTASSERPNRRSIEALNKPRSLRSSDSNRSSPVKSNTATPTKKKAAITTSKRARKEKLSAEGSHQAKNGSLASVEVKIDVSPSSPKGATAIEEAEDDEDKMSEGPQYWLMKAEPESRIEKDKDVKFSIDDLQAATSPEAWDGVRNYAARNNMRAMVKGDQAFFYHSNCKVPGIAGTMEIVQEHSVDDTAFDEAHPYYDEKSDKASPRWCVVHVEFRQKFSELIKLKELQKYAKDGGTLEKMQMLRQSRLSVSKVSKKEWDFILGLVDEEVKPEVAKMY